MRHAAKLVLGAAIAVVLLWLLFRDTSASDLWDSICALDVRWLIASQIVVIAGVLAKVQRWKSIVKPVQSVSYRHLFSATQIGYTANFVLPFRLGELVRALVLTRLTGVATVKAVALAAMDRVADVFGLAAVMAIAASALCTTPDLNLPRDALGFPETVTFSASYVRAGAWITFAMVASAIVILATLYFNQRFILRAIEVVLTRVSARFAAITCRLLSQAVGGLMVFESGAALARSLVMSLVTWATYLLGTQCLVWAFRIHAPWYFSFVQTAVLAVGISVPSAPGLVGQYQIPIVIVLTMLVPGLPVTDAKAFAVVSYAALEVPVILLGVFCLFWEKLNLLELAREAPVSKA